MKQKCFEHCKIKRINCKVDQCRYWINYKEYNNCCLIGSESVDKITLQNIGEIFDVTRMRICQIEKIAIKKLKEKVLSMI